MRRDGYLETLPLDTVSPNDIEAMRRCVLNYGRLNSRYRTLDTVFVLLCYGVLRDVAPY